MRWFALTLAVGALIAGLPEENVALASGNTWSSGAPMPTAVWFPGGVAVLRGKIYVMGGFVGAFESTPIANTQIYDPVANSWSAGTPLPTNLEGGAAAVVNNVLYVMGGSTTGQLYDYTTAVWAFDRKTSSWTAKAPMPTALHDAGVAVENGVIYLVGGNSASQLRADTVESYNPATDTWTTEAPLAVGKSEPSVALLTTTSATTIVAADGNVDGGTTGDNEGYDAADNAWATLMPDPTPRGAACTGGRKGNMYVAAGETPALSSINLNERFSLSTDTWKTLASVPQPMIVPGSVMYKGRLYCFGGATSFPSGTVLNNVQIYQP